MEKRYFVSMSLKKVKANLYSNNNIYQNFLVRAWRKCRYFANSYNKKEKKSSPPKTQWFINSSMYVRGNNFIFLQEMFVMLIGDVNF